MAYSMDLRRKVLANWKAEMKRFTPTLKACFLHPSETDKATLAATGRKPGQALAKTNVVLTTYGMLTCPQVLYQCLC